MQEDGKVVIGTELDTKGFDKEINILEDKLNDIKATLQMADEDKTLFSTREIKEMEAEAQKLGRRIDTLKEKQAELENAGFIKMKQSIDNIGNSMQKVIKRVIKWGLAVIGVRSAYSGIRRAISLVQSNNEQVANTFKIMQMAIANTLTPLVEKIVGLIKNLMLYIDYIYFKVTNKHLFDFAKAFEDANKSAKDLKKTTAGFDEMNIVGDNSSSTGMSENPFAGWENFKAPKWLDKMGDFLVFIKDNWKTIVAGILAIGLALLAWKLLSTAKGVSEMGTSFTGFFSSIGKAVEAIAILGGLTLVIQTLTDMINVFAQSGLEVADVITLMVTIIGSLVVLITALTVAAKLLQNPLAMGGLLVLAGSIVAILLVIQGLLPVLLDFIDGLGPAINKFVDNTTQAVTKLINFIVSGIEFLVNSVVVDGLNAIINGINKIGKYIGFTIPVVPDFHMRRFVPKLAKGGIVNNPGPGVMMGSYIAGEKGPEAVIPLDDQTLDRLGLAFARHTNINVSLTNTMNGRVISRELQKVQNENNFAYNR